MALGKNEKEWDEENSDDWDPEDWEDYFASVEPEAENQEYDFCQDHNGPDGEILSECGEASQFESGHFDVDTNGNIADPNSQGAIAIKEKHDPSWHYDSSGHYPYILINGSPDEFKAALRLFKSRNFQCPLFGPSYKPASNGIQYAWYIRIFAPDGGRPNTHQLAEVIQATISHGPKKKEVKKSYAIELAIQHANEIKCLENRLAHANEISAEYQLRDRLKSTQVDKLEQLCRSLEANIESLKEKLGRQKRIVEDSFAEADWYRKRLSGLAGKNADISDLQKSNQFLSAKIEQLNDAVNRRDNELFALQKERQCLALENEKLVLAYDADLAILDQCKSRLEDVQKECATLKESAGRARRPKLRLFEENLACTLSCLLPDLIIEKGSICFMANEIKSTSGCLKALYWIANRSENMDAPRFRPTRVRSTKHWLELRFNTGLDCCGRIYYRKVNGGSISVVVSHKKLQSFDIGNLEDS